MTLEELRSICAQIVSRYMVLAKTYEDVGVEVACESIAEAIQAIQLPEQEPVAALEKQIADLKLSLRAAIETIDVCGISFSEESMKLARERSKC